MKYPKSGEPKWKNMVAWVRNTLCQRGAIARPVKGEEGIWSITERGRWMVAEATQEATAPPQAGGHAQAQKLTKVKRSSIAKKAAQTHWQKQYVTIMAETGRQTVSEAAHHETTAQLPLVVSPPSSPALSSPRVVTLGNALRHRLRTTAQSGVDATAFEEALAEAFSLLGFNAVKIGGRGDTDIRVTAPLVVHPPSSLHFSWRLGRAM